MSRTKPITNRVASALKQAKEKKEDSNVPEYEKGFPRTLDKKPTQTLDVYEQAIERDSTAIEKMGPFREFFARSFDPHTDPFMKLQVNREYREKLKSNK